MRRVSFSLVGKQRPDAIGRRSQPAVEKRTEGYRRAALPDDIAEKPQSLALRAAVCEREPREQPHDSVVSRASLEQRQYDPRGRHQQRRDQRPGVPYRAGESRQKVLRAAEQRLDWRQDLVRPCASGCDRRPDSRRGLGDRPHGLVKLPQQNLSRCVGRGNAPAVLQLRNELRGSDRSCRCHCTENNCGGSLRGTFSDGRTAFQTELCCRGDGASTGGADGTAAFRVLTGCVLHTCGLHRGTFVREGSAARLARLKALLPFVPHIGLSLLRRRLRAWLFSVCLKAKTAITAEFRVRVDLLAALAAEFYLSRHSIPSSCYFARMQPHLLQ